MDPQEPDQSWSNGKNPLSNAERQRKYRDKLTFKETGKIAVSLFEEAKAEICSMEQPSLTKLMEQEKYKGGLLNEEITKLNTFIKNHKQKLKTQQCFDQQKEMLEVAIREKVKRIGTQQGSELHRDLLTAQSENERSQMILEKINENKYLFIEYLESFQPPTQDFLRIIVGLNQRIDDLTFTQLFVRVCALHKGEELLVTAQMAMKAMAFLSDSQDNHVASFGLLRLMFQNDITVKDFSIELLQRFQEQYGHTISNFFKTLPLVKSHVIDQLPSTPFCFTLPMLKCFKEGCDILNRQVPYQFQPHIVEIICFSFESNQEEFDKFLNVFKEGCFRLYESLRLTAFQNLLIELSNRMRQMQQPYFKNLKHATSVLERTYDLITEKKIITFDPQTVSSLIGGGHDQFIQMKARPRIIKQQGANQLTSTLHSLQQANDKLDLGELIENNPLHQEHLKSFKALQISTLLPLQELALRMCISTKIKGRYFFQYETGQGKTALCLGIACCRAVAGESVMIVNQSEELTFRDYKNAAAQSHQLPCKIDFLGYTKLLQLKEGSVYYSHSESFFSFIQECGMSSLANTTIILDEFDSLIYERHDDIEQRLHCLSQLNSSFAFSGSELSQPHINLINVALKGTYINFSFRAIGKIEPACCGKRLHLTLKDQLEDVMLISFEQSKITPVIIIITQGAEQLIRLLKNKGLRTENLRKLQPTEIDACLKFFTQKSQEHYPVYLINPKQGRGIDFQSSTEIESNGGVYLIIATLPDCYLQFKQFVGRTGRVGNKGQYSVILHDRQGQNYDGETYLTKKLQVLSDEDTLFLSKVGHQTQNLNIIADNENEEEELKESEIPINKQIQEEVLLDVNQHQLIQEREMVAESVLPIIEKSQQVQIRVEKSSAPVSEQQQKVHAAPKKKREVKNFEKIIRNELKILRSRWSPKDEIDSRYFDGYGETAIHQEMLADNVRMEAYSKALLLLAKGHSVVEVGAGTGALSIMAIESGAEIVYGIENSRIINSAIKQIKERNLEDKIKFIHGMAEVTKPPNGKVDILVSEWMGYFLIYENMLSSVLTARNAWLKEEGIIIPRTASLSLACITSVVDENGLLVRTMKCSSYSEAVIEQCTPEEIISTSYQILHLDLKRDTLQDNSFSSDFEMTITKSDILAGFVGWFDCLMTEDINLSTAPTSEPTHWKQTIFPLQRNQQARKDDRVTGSIQVQPLPENHRGLEIIITYSISSSDMSIKQSFHLS